MAQEERETDDGSIREVTITYEAFDEWTQAPGKVEYTVHLSMVGIARLIVAADELAADEDDD